MNEEWREIPGFDGAYEASSEGRIRSVHAHPKGRTKAGHVMALATHSNGYLNVGVRENGKRRVIGVHRLVCAAFHGAPEAGWEARHIDGDQRNNAAENLAWGTHAENVGDSVAAGTHYSHGRTRTACKRGHAFSDQNTHIDPTGRRVCRACNALRARERRASKNQAASAVTN